MREEIESRLRSRICPEASRPEERIASAERNRMEASEEVVTSTMRGSSGRQA